MLGRIRTTAIAVIGAAALAVTSIATPAAGAAPLPRAAAVKAAPTTFTHPGVLVSRAQLTTPRSKVQAGQQPWKAAYDNMMASSYASLSRTAKPRAVVECGSSSNPNRGCTDERPGRHRGLHPSARLVLHQGRQVRQEVDRDHGRLVRDHQGPHQQQRPAADRMGRVVLARAAEIINYTYTGWSAASVAASPPCFAPSTCRRSSTVRTATATGN